MKALKPAELKRRNADLATGAQLAIRLGEVILTSEVRAPFALLPPSLFDAAQLDLVAQVGWAALAVDIERQKALAAFTSAKLTPELDASSKERRDRMFALAEYQSGDDPRWADEIADIGSGRGHLDRAQDLARLADYYDAEAERVAKDAKHYRSDDAALARQESDAIMGALAAGGAELGFVDKLRRVWTLLDATYRDVKATLDWVYRADPHRPKVPALAAHAAGRRSSATPAPSAPP